MDMIILKDELSAIDDDLPAIEKTVESKSELSIVKVALNTLKLETIYNFIEEECDDPDILEAFKMYSGIASESMKSLTKFVPDR